MTVHAKNMIHNVHVNCLPKLSQLPKSCAET